MELFTYTFVQYAFLGGMIMSIFAGIFGPFVVQSNQSYASDTLAHVALAGIGAALLTGVNPWLGSLPALLIISVIMWWLLDIYRENVDAISVLFLSGGLALGLTFVHIAEDPFFSFEQYLFGSILTLSGIDIVSMSVALLAVGVLIWALWYPLIGATQTPRYTVPYTKRPHIVSLLFFLMLAVVVWVGIKTIGGLLVGALLVIPTLSTRVWSNSFSLHVIYTTVCSVASMILGLLLALVLDVPPSSIIILTLITVFILQLIARTVLQK